MNRTLRVKNAIDPKTLFADAAVQLTIGAPLYVGFNGNSATLMVNFGSMHGVVMSIASKVIYPWVTVWGSPTDEMLKDLAYHIERVGGQLFDDVAEIRIEGGFDARTV